MNDNLHTILSDSGCPPQQVLEDYFFGRLTEEEMHRVERHLVDCELCSDVVEGLAAMQDPASLDRIVVELNERIDRETGRVRRLRPGPLLMAAAAALVLIATSVVILRLVTRQAVPDQTPLAVEMQELPPPAPAAERTERIAPQESFRKDDAIQGAAASRPVKKETVPVTQDEVALTSPQPLASFDADTLSPVAATEVLEFQAPLVGLINRDSEKKAAEAVMTEQELPRMRQDERTSQSLLLGKEGSSVRTTSAQPGIGVTANIGAADSALAIGNYREAARHYSAVLDRSPDHADARYGLSLCWFRLKNYRKASQVLEPLLNDPSGKRFRDARILSDSIGLMKQTN